MTPPTPRARKPAPRRRLKDFTPLPAQALRNRAEAIDLLMLGRAKA